MGRTPEVHVHLHLPNGDEVEERLAGIEHLLAGVVQLLRQIKRQGAEIMADLTPIENAVERILDENSDTLVALRYIADQVRANAGNPAQVLAIADTLNATADVMQAAEDEVADVVTPPVEEPPVEEPPA